MFIKESGLVTASGSNPLTSGSPLKYQLTKRGTTTNNPTRNDALMVASSCMRMKRKGEGGLEDLRGVR